MTSPSGERQSFSTTQVFEFGGKAFTDQTGRFPITSSQGAKYILVLFHQDTNSILAEPFKKNTQEELVNKQQKLHKYLLERGHKIKMQVLDNECPTQLKEFFRKKV